ncbi:DUF1178 family protein [Palleronia caenipelagi]|uniref:DUF1178 family protein n=1 Tax=Palleronia caenipelagi TaxID=2489174 RepID=A0A547QAA0_9RHOB|nr:DUF1178 family protein [Palleronia caenipelagi]TRD23325.1 DUF1178 family protein [Palleronia caenipelagi]
MIRYALKCSNDHSFESWFRSADDYDKLAGLGQVTCIECGDTQVQKALMAPRVPAKGKEDSQPHPLEMLRKKVEAEADYMGEDFAKEARAIHDGDAPERPIWGEAKLDEAKKLLDDGIQVAPLPFRPSSKLC